MWTIIRHIHKDFKLILFKMAVFSESSLGLLIKEKSSYCILIVREESVLILRISFVNVSTVAKYLEESS